MADCFQALTKIAVARSGGQPAFVSTGSTTSTLVGNVNVSGVLTSGTDTTQFASQTQAYTSTLSGNQLTFASGSITTAFTSTLSVGTILNFSAGGSIGTSLYLTGTLATPYASITSGSIGTLLAGSLSASTVAGNIGSLSTLTVGTILNLNFAGTLGTNLTLLGTIVAPTGSITKTSYAATLTVGTILNFLQGQTVSTSGTIAGTFASNTAVFPGSGSFTGTLSAQTLFVGTLTTLPVSGNIASNIAGPVTILNGVNDNSRMLSALDGSMGSATTRSIALGQNNSNGNEAELGFYYVGSNSSLNSMQLGIYGKQIMTLQNSGNVGINTTLPAYSLDVNGSARISGAVIGTNLQLLSGNANTGTYLGNVLSQLQFQYAGSGYPHMIRTRHNGNASAGNSIDFALWNYGTDSSTVTFPTKYALTVDGVGIGINNTTPSYPLDVSGSARITSMLILSNTLTSTQPLMVSSPTAQAQLVLSAGTGTTYRAARIDFFAGSSTSMPQWLMINDYNQTGINDFRICASNQASVIPITCLQNGNVGINTANPAFGLDVAGIARVNNLTYNLTTTGSYSSALYPGLTAGNQVFSIWGSSTAGQGGAAYLNYFAGSTLTASSRWGLYGMYTDALTVAAAGNTCNVGVNNNAPSYALDVSGSARVSGSLIGSNGVISRPVPTTLWLYMSGTSPTYPYTTTTIVNFSTSANVWSAVSATNMPQATYINSSGNFMPPVAGIYMVHFTGNGLNAEFTISKNGSAGGNYNVPGILTVGNQTCLSTSVYLNGSSDYVSIGVYCTNSGGGGFNNRATVQFTLITPL